jgi:hypothetical protein
VRSDLAGIVVRLVGEATLTLLVLTLDVFSAVLGTNAVRSRPTHGAVIPRA